MSGTFQPHQSVVRMLWKADGWNMTIVRGTERSRNPAVSVGDTRKPQDNRFRTDSKSGHGF